MLDDQVAQAITVKSVRETGGIDTEIDTEFTLRKCRIRTDAAFEELKITIIDKVEAVGFAIDKDSFRDIDQDTKVGTVSGIVTTARPRPNFMFRIG